MMALPMNSLYSLTWGDYGTSLVSAIQLLRCHGDLVDCTLAAGGRSFPAHKIVLCAASPFLLELLKNTPCKHPVVMLAGVNANDLEALLEFVYRGEVSVDHAQLPSLLQAAQCLNIQGLAPQTVTKDDFTTHSIQLQHMIPQQHHDQDQLIATIAAAPQQTVHAQVVEDIHQTGQILQTATQATPTGQQQTIVTTDAPKDVIQQFLPARKRKPRVKKMSPTASKVTKVEGMDNIMTTPTTTHAGNVQQQQQQQQIHQQQQQQQHGIENGNEGPGMTSTPHIKSEVTKVETIVSVDPLMLPGSAGGNSTTGGDTTVGSIPTTPATKSGKRSKNPNSSEKPRSRSQSEQPATCPICYAVIRQSRNLRRHLELRHFAKPGVKKEKKSKSDLDDSMNASADAAELSGAGETGAAAAVGGGGAAATGGASGGRAGTSSAAAAAANTATATTTTTANLNHSNTTTYHAVTSSGAPQLTTMTTAATTQQQLHHQQQQHQQQQHHTIMVNHGGPPPLMKQEPNVGGGNVIHIVNEQVFAP